MRDVKSLRKELGLSQNELADKLGITPRTIRRWEKGDVIPKEDTQRTFEQLLADIPQKADTKEDILSGQEDIQKEDTQNKMSVFDENVRLEADIKEDISQKADTSNEKVTDECDISLKSDTDVTDECDTSNENVTVGEQTRSSYAEEDNAVSSGTREEDTHSSTQEEDKTDKHDDKPDSPKFDDRPLPEIAQAMFDWCLSHGCQVLGDAGKEYRITCPNTGCPSREKSEIHKAFDINKDKAFFNCFHCGLKGQGIHGSKGLIAQLDSGDFSFSATVSLTPVDKQLDMIKPKEKSVPIMSKEEYAEVSKNGISNDAKKYLVERGTADHAFRNLHIFSIPKGTQLSFMKFAVPETTLCFPVLDSEANVVFMQYRPLSGKAYNEGQKPIYLTIPTPLSIIVTESIFDALSVYMAGYQGAALLGTSITASHDLSIFENKSVIVMLDSDEEGKAGAKKVASKISGIAKDVRIAEIPPELDCKDANEVLVSAGKEKLTELIQNAIEYSDITPAVVIETPETTVNVPAVTTEVDTSVVSEPETQTQNKPKKESGFPAEAWRGIFEAYRQAQEGTTEAPEYFHFAVFKTIAGTVIGRTCYAWNGRCLYPNYYTVLIGETGCKKSTAVERGVNLLMDTEPLIITQSGLATPEGLIGRLQVPPEHELENLSETEQQRAISVSEHEGYRMFVTIDEFAALLKKAKKESGSGIIQVLNNAYDCPPKLENPTLTRPLSARKPFVSMITLSTQEWLEANLDIDDIYGGFANRNVFYLGALTEPLYNPPMPEPSALNRIKLQLERTRRTLKDKHVLYTFAPNADILLKEWYEERWRHSHDSEIVDLALKRIDPHVRKLALLYAVFENAPDDTEIKLDQLEAAIAVGDYWQATTIEIFGKFGATKTIKREMKILEFIASKPSTKGELHRKLGGAIGSKELAETLKYLLTVERIQTISEEYTDTAKRKRRRTMYTPVENR